MSVINLDTIMSMNNQLQEKTYDVFISYSRDDLIDPKTHEVMPNNHVYDLLRFLDRNKINYWIDTKEIDPSDDYAKIIENNLMKSKAVLFLSSCNSNNDQKEWVYKEIHYAVEDLHIPIIPFLLDSSKFLSGLGIELSRFEKILYYKNYKKGRDQLLKAINKIRSEYETRKKEAELAAERQAKLEKEAREKQERVKKEEEERIKKELARKQALAKYNELKEDYQLSVNNSKLALGKLLSQKIILEGTKPNVECPICGKTYDEYISWCYRCGFKFIHEFDKFFMNEDEKKNERQRVLCAQNVWNEKKEYNTLNQKLSEQKALIDEMNLKELEQKNQIKELSNTINQLKNSLSASNTQLMLHEKKIQNIKNELTTKIKDLDRANSDNLNLKQSLKAKDDEIQRLLQNITNTSRKEPIAFLLVEENDETNVYLLYEGTNYFGSEYKDITNHQMIVACESSLKSKHFSLTSTDKKTFILQTYGDAKVSRNSKNNYVNNIEVFCGDILYIGELKVLLKDNFKK